MPSRPTLPLPPSTPAPRAVAPLVEAAKLLIAQGRFDRTPIDEIARLAGVSRRSFHNHFSDRDELAARVVEQVRLAMNARILAAVGDVDDPAERLLIGLFTAFRCALESELTERVLLRIAPGTADPGNPGITALSQELRSGSERGSFRLASLDAAVVLVLGLFDFGVGQLRQLRDGAEPGTDAAARRLMQGFGIVMLQGLRVRGHRFNGPAAAALVDRTLAFAFHTSPDVAAPADAV